MRESLRLKRERTPMTLDDQLRHTLDALAERLRGDVTSYLERATKELMVALEAERARVSEQITRDIRAETEREISVRLRTLENNEPIVTMKAAPLRAMASGRGGAAIHARVASPAAEHADLGGAPEAAHRETNDVDFPREKRADTTADADSGRVLEGIRALDHSASLSEILDLLVLLAAKETPRAGVFLASGPPLRSWRCKGFELTVDESRSFEIAAEEAGIIREAIRTGAAAASDGGLTSIPSFARLAFSCDALALPLTMGGQVVAVLYADAGVARTMPPGRRATLEILARHATRSLQVVTAFRAARLLTSAPDLLASPAGVGVDSSR
jgi:hypothetical protein